MDEATKTQLLKELKDWRRRNSYGLSVHEKNKYGPKISDAAEVFIKQNRYRITRFSTVLQIRSAESDCMWSDEDFEALEDTIKTLQDEINFLRTVI